MVPPIRSLLLAGLAALAGTGLAPRAARAQPVTLGTNCYASAQGATACTIDRRIDPGALCNDGTTPAFWFRPGTGSGSTRLVIWLEGGSDCRDQTSCSARAAPTGSPQLVTSKGFMPGAGQGLLSRVQSVSPLLYNANILNLHYCSSDSWQGDRAPSGAVFNPNDVSTWSFTGRRNALATIASVKALVPATFDRAAMIVIGGTSAGGEGATVVVNDLLPLLPRVPTVFVNDAGFALDIPAFDPQSITPPYEGQSDPTMFETTLAARLAFWNGRGDVRCDALATTTAEHAACSDSAFVLDNGFIQLPSFVAEFTLDTAQITQELCPSLYGKCHVSHDPASKPGMYATAFGAAMQKALLAQGTQAAFTAYSGDIYGHVDLENTAAFTTPLPVGTAMVAPRDVFDAWLANPAASRRVVLGTGPGVQ